MNAQDSIQNLTSNASTVARQIVFILGAVSWGLIYSAETDRAYFELIPIICMVLAIIYFVIDLLQYFISATKLRALEYEYFEAQLISETIDDEGMKNYVLERLSIEKISYKYFKIKFCVLPVILFLLLICFIGKF